MSSNRLNKEQLDKAGIKGDARKATSYNAAAPATTKIDVVEIKKRAQASFADITHVEVLELVDAMSDSIKILQSKNLNLASKWEVLAETLITRYQTSKNKDFWKQAFKNFTDKELKEYVTFVETSSYAESNPTSIQKRKALAGLLKKI